MQKKTLCVAPRLKSSDALVAFYINIRGVQPRCQTADVLVPLFALQIEQICDVPFLRITFPFFPLKRC
jgi:hypothetical protein